MWPYPHSLKSELSPIEKHQNVFVAEGDKLLACTSRKSIGAFVARIISDPRTLNQVVITYDVELSRRDAWKVAEKLTGEDFSDYPHVRMQSLLFFFSKLTPVKMSADEIKSKLQDANPVSSVQYGYSIILHVRGDNTVANAKAGGVLDARELYPDYQPVTAEEGAIQFYKEPMRIYLPESVASQLASIV